MLMPMASYAQDTNWEVPTEVKKEVSKEAAPKKAKEEKAEKKKYKAKDDPKYLAGAAPIVDGYVQWTLDLDIPGKSASEIYATTYSFIEGVVSGPNHVDGSRIALVNKAEHGIVATVKEWLIYKDKFLNLDRSKISYVLKADATDGHLKLNLTRIVIDYSENMKEPDGVDTAENWISDEKALSKKGKIYPGCQKHRIKMIDRKDEIFSQLKALFK